jgi:hypothetical protein
VPEPPPPRAIRTWQDAELNAADWMRYWGYDDAHVTPSGPDAGLDIVAAQAVGQVKAMVGNVSGPDLQRLYGARGLAHHKSMLFFALANYTTAARTYAQHTGMAIFNYGIDGSMAPVNDIARQVVDRAAGRPPTGQYRPPPSRWLPVGRWLGCNWRLVAAAFVLLTPYTTIRGSNYPGPWWTDVPEFIGIWLACGAAGTALILWHARAKRWNWPTFMRNLVRPGSPLHTIRQHLQDRFVR